MEEKRLESWDLAMEDVSAHFIIDEQGLVTAIPNHSVTLCVPPPMDDFYSFMNEHDKGIIAHFGLPPLVPSFTYTALFDFMESLKNDLQPSWLIAHETVRQLHIMRSKRPHLRKLRKCQLRRIKRNEAKRHGR